VAAGVLVAAGFRAAAFLAAFFLAGFARRAFALRAGFLAAFFAGRALREAFRRDAALRAFFFFFATVSPPVMNSGLSPVNTSQPDRLVKTSGRQTSGRLTEPGPGGQIW
jgi:hypothetical protein